jgi:hypothetical protein
MIREEFRFGVRRGRGVITSAPNMKSSVLWSGRGERAKRRATVISQLRVAETDADLPGLIVPTWAAAKAP